MRAPRLTAAAVAVAMTALAAAPAAAQQGETGTRLRVNAAEITIGGRVHTQFNTTSADDEPATEMLLRRVRLEASVRVNDVVRGKVQPDFAGDEVEVKDAYLELALHPAFRVLAGKAYKPFSRLELTSSNRILPIERGARIRGVEALDHYGLVNGLEYSDRAIGLQVSGAPEGAPLGLGYAFGVFNGPEQGELGDRDSYQTAARLTAELAPELEVGLGWSSRDFSDRELGGIIEVHRGHAFEADLEYGAFDPGFHLLAEVATGDVSHSFSEDRFLAAQAWLAYRTQPLGVVSALEPTFRASWGDVEVASAPAPLAWGTLLTPGINVHLGGLNRVMFNYDVWLPDADGSDAESSFRAQFQLAF